jgi:hypothetical protein
MDPAMQAQIEGLPLTGALAGADESVTVELGQQAVLFIMPEDLLANKQAQEHVAGHVAGQRIPWECVDTHNSPILCCTQSCCPACTTRSSSYRQLANVLANVLSPSTRM